MGRQEGTTSDQVSSPHGDAGEPREPTAAGPVAEETAKLLRELRLHQVELEAQNAELRRSQDALEDSEARYRKLYDLTPVSYVTFGDDGRIVDANLTAANLFGCERQLLLQRPLASFVLSEDQDLLYHLRRRLRQGESSQSAELRILARDEGPCWVRLDATRTDDEQGTLYRACLMDIRARKAAEERIRGHVLALEISRDTEARYRVELDQKVEELAREKARAEAATEAKSRFLSSMSHELRTPMTGVLGMTEMLLGTELDADQRDYVETLSASASSLLGILNNILDFSKIEAGRVDLESIPFSLHELLDQIVSSLALGAESKRVDLLLSISPRVPRTYVGDAGRVRQILLNVVSNALKFTERGHVLVELDVEETDVGAGSLSFSVEDTGIGISPEQQETLFSRFQQATPSTSRRYGGTGLGLAIARQLSELMGGRLTMTSAVGVGSTFRLALPLPHGQSPRTEKATGGSFTGVHVLVADSHPRRREITRHLCLQQGMAVTETSSWEETIARLRGNQAETRPYAVVLFDDGLSNLALSAAAMALRSALGGSDVKLVALSTLDGRRERSAARAVGLDATVPKPLRESLLLTCFRELLGAGTDAARAGAPRERTPDLVSSHQLRVLLIDDNRTNLKVAEALLRRLGCEVDAADNGQAGAALAARTHYDFIFTDCEMPEVDGFEAVRRIRGSEGAGRHATIVALTASATEETRGQCLAAGMDDYLSKPVSGLALRAMIGRWLEVSRSLRANAPRPL